MDEVVDFKLVKFEWSIKVVFDCERRLTETHLVSSVRTETVDLTFGCESKRVAITAANLYHFVEDFLHSCWLVDKNLAAEDSVSQAQLALTVVSKSI